MNWAKNDEMESKEMCYFQRNSKVDGLIVTLTGYYNYGNIIQRYALKHVLKQNGRIFDTTYIETLNDTTLINNSIFENTHAFVRKYIGGEDFDEKKLQGYRNYIVGSDQVWRDWSDEWARFAPFFFEFVDDSSKFNYSANRISYAASFGVNKVNSAMGASTQTRIGPLLKKFSAISVREESGRDIVRNTWGLDSIVVLDPTLLLRSSDYSELIENSNSKNTEIGKVFGYILDVSKKKIRFIEKISRALGGKKTMFICPSVWGVRRLKRFEPVEKWLKGFRDAEFVVTDSYHGMLFSMINNKEFVVVGNALRGLARFESFLGFFGLSKRLVGEKKLKNVDRKSVV